VISFFRSRWRGTVALEQLLWRDMLLHGSAINLVLGLASLILFATEASDAIAATVHFAPLPYNVFLLAAVWRAADKAPQRAASIARVVAVAWVVAFIVI
jgi:hypothetical protein